MNYFFDTEFIEDGKTIDLISIGMVCDDGRELYMVSSEYDESKANDWVKKHVLNHIGANQKKHTRKAIADAISVFTLAPLLEVDAMDEYPEFTREYSRPCFWAYYASYDWVALCQLFGAMIDMPKHLPHYVHDLKQHMNLLGMYNHNLPSQSGTNHHALDDARWNKIAYDFVEEKRLCPF